MHIKKNDSVIILAGKHKGEKGTIEKVFPAANRVIVAGLNIAKKHMKPRKQGQKGSIVEKAMPIHASNVRLADKVKKSAKK